MSQDNNFKFFNELTDEESKSNAAYQVYKKGYIEGEYDYELEYEDIDEDMQEKIRETGLKISEFRWWDNYGIWIDMKKSSITDEYLNKVLPPIELEQIKDMDIIGFTKHLLFSEELTVDYMLDFDYFEAKFDTWLVFFNKYSKDEDRKNYFKVLAGFEENDEVRKEVINEVVELANNLAEEISKKVLTNIKELQRQIIASIKRRKDYLESEDFFFEALKERDEFIKKYQFNQKGDIIRIDGKYTDEYLEELNQLEEDSEDDEE